jgi:hypothetical protein
MIRGALIVTLVAPMLSAVALAADAGKAHLVAERRAAYWVQDCDGGIVLCRSRMTAAGFVLPAAVITLWGHVEHTRRYF